MFIIILYFIISIIKSNGKAPDTKSYENVFINIMITELLYMVFTSYYTFGSFSFINLGCFLIFQDLYYYSIHRLAHCYGTHMHHDAQFHPFNAWYENWLFHIILNLGSIGISFFLFPNSYITFMAIVIVQTYTSINGHTDNSKHNKHHLNPSKRFGSIYLFDYLLDSY